MTPRRWRQLLVVLFGLLPVLAVDAENGVRPDEIRLGMANAQSGPAAGLGNGMRAGAQAYFTRINAEGGIHDRKITLIVKDDGYEPARSVAHTEALIETDKVFALLGYVGTPTSRAAVPIALRAQVPYLFPFTGAEFLRTPVKPWVFNIRASYFDETEEMVERMTADLGIGKIALLMQDDSFGETVKSGVVGALHKRGLQIHAEARVQRNSLDVEAAIAALLPAQPEAIVFIGTYQQLAAVIAQAKARDSAVRFFTVSFIGTEDFIAAAGANADGVYITQVMPSPHDASRAIIRNYLADIAPADVGYTSLEGYIGAVVFVAALRDTGPQPTRLEFAKALEALNIDLGGFKVAFSPSSHQGSDAVFPSEVRDGRAVPVETMR